MNRDDIKQQLSVSTAPSTDTSIGSTPTAGTGTLGGLYEQNGYTPPNKEDQKEMPVLQMSGYVNALQGGWWDRLDGTKQTKLSFLILRNQHKLLRNAIQKLHPDLSEDAVNSKVSVELQQALDEGTTYGQKLLAYVRKGGDLQASALETAARNMQPNLLEAFLEKHPEFLDYNSAPTIFNNPTLALKPLYRFQSGNSTLCCLVASANIAFYAMCLKCKRDPIVNGADHGALVEDYALNINRFMRDRFTDEEVFANIFQNAGGHASTMVLRLLKPFNPGFPDWEIITTVHLLSLDDASSRPEEALYPFRTSALMIENFKLFPQLWEGDQIVFSGNYDDLKDGKERLDHSMLLIGACRAPTMGGLAFLVQNSWPEKPFLVIGLDLLHSMGVTKLLAVQPGLNFYVGPHVLLEHTDSTVSGSSPRKTLNFDAALFNDYEERLESDDEPLLATRPFWECFWNPNAQNISDDNL